MNQPVLSYREFITYIQENVEDRLEGIDVVNVAVTEVEKNNGVVFDTLAIERRGRMCAPVFYLKDLYGEYLQGENIGRLVERIVAHYRNYTDAYQDLDFGWFCRFENVREKIVLKVVNYDRNRGQLENCPYIRDLDLALTFRILMEHQTDRMGTILVNDEMMKEWEVTEFDLFNLAVENMQRIWHPTLEPVQDVLEMLMQTGSRNEQSGLLYEPPMFSMYVLSNDVRLNGATVLFYTDCIRQFAAKAGRDIYVLPSSIHEVLLVPEREEMSAWDLRQIVEQVNHQLVTEEEILSDHVYRYLYREDKLIIGA